MRWFAARRSPGRLRHRAGGPHADAGFILCHFHATFYDDNTRQAPSLGLELCVKGGLFVKDFLGETLSA
ncbi:MAG: hypothetical protein HRU01_20615 [Myxococcales bacterium]|nr:hypothetical protein [Myxococcales bacterium]